MSTLLNVIVPAAIAVLAGSLVRRAVRRERAVTVLAVPDRDDVDSWGVGDLHPPKRTIHQTPAHDAAPVTPCCDTSLALLPLGDSVSHEQKRVTCGGKEPS